MHVGITRRSRSYNNRRGTGFPVPLRFVRMQRSLLLNHDAASASNRCYGIGVVWLAYLIVINDDTSVLAPDLNPDFVHSAAVKLQQR